MPLYLTLIILGIFLTATYYIESVSIPLSKKKSARINSQPEYMFSSIVRVAPLVLLFYTGQFWPGAILLIPFYLYLFVLVLIFKRVFKRSLPLSIFQIFLPAIASLIIAIIAYYIFFRGHQEVIVQSELLRSTGQTEMVYWPYIVFGLLCSIYLLAVLADWIKKSDAVFSAGPLDVVIMATPFLAMFTHHYWRDMLLGNVIVFTLINLTIKYAARETGGMLTAFSLIIILASIVSMVIYGIFF